MSARVDQAALAAWIWGQGGDPPAGLRPLQGHAPEALARALSAYREHAKALAVRALSQAYPLLAQWLGAADFAGLAWAYARRHPPQQGDMNRWGLSLPAFLAALPQMDAEPPALAALEAHLHGLSYQADAAPPDPALWDRLRTLPADAVGLYWHPSLALFALPRSLAPLWPDEDGPADWRVAWRQEWQPRSLPVSAAEAQLLRLSLARQSLAEALEQTLAEHGDFDLGSLLAKAWQLGWLQDARALAAE